MARSAELSDHEQKLRTIVHSNQQIRDAIQCNVNDFIRLREDLLKNSEVQQLERYNDVLAPLIEGPRIEHVNLRIVSNKVQLAFCGENSSGKTAFIHKFLEIGKILPSGDGPVTARITKLTYAPGEQARICIKKTLDDQTIAEDGTDLSLYFVDEKPKWMDIARTLSKYLKRPQNMEETSADFANWARCLVEIHIPSPTLSLGIDVYDTPGFLLDDAPVLKEILHDLVELIHPTIVFMYGNPSTDDATKGCFLAMKTALRDLDNTSIFFLNSKADINQMVKFKQNMKVDEFLSVLFDERARRYQLLLSAPFLANNELEGLPASVEECRYFDLCSVNSQLNKPYGPLMNEATIQRIIQFVANNDLVVATRICKLISPIIDAFFYLLALTRHRSPEQLLQLHFDAMNWTKIYFKAYTLYTEDCLKDLLSNIFQKFIEEEESIVQTLSNIRNVQDSFKYTIQSAVRLQVITPAIRHTIQKFMSSIFDHITSNYDLARGAVYNETLNQALGRQDISDFAALLLGNSAYKRPVDVCILYMINTISTPILQCAQSLRNLDLTVEITETAFLKQKLINDQTGQKRIDTMVREYLLSMQAVIQEQRGTMRDAVRLWGDQQKAVLRSIIDYHYKTVSPLISSHQEILEYLERYTCDFILIECKLRAAQDMANFNGNELKVQSDDSKSTMFSIFIATWGSEKNLVVKKLSKFLLDQPNAAFYEAHYHLQVASLRHPNIMNLRYLYEHRLDNQTSELWMIFPSIRITLEQFLQQPEVSVSIKTAIEWLNSIADALTVLHENEIVHRNVVLSNIVLTEDRQVMLIDLGDWHGNCDLSTRHKPSSTLFGTNDDMRAFGEIGQHLNLFIEQDEEIPAIIEIFLEVIHKCLQASHESPVTAQFAQKKFQRLLEMF